MIRKLLIANRGEIACRILRTCRSQGVPSVAVYSTVDQDLPHVRLADEAVAIGPAPARKSYLDMNKIIAAAKQTGANAIHPGYGFLSENAAFAEACQAADICFVGPGANAIRLMGDKAAARQHMQQHDVPVLPGFDQATDDDQVLANEAEKVGFPLLIKAVAGGGGKGMRIVNQPQDFSQALAAAKREAAGAFGDDRVLLERYLPTARHVEVQVFADRHGNAVYLFERDCSVQRRHQKIIEEAPAPGIDNALRESLGNAAVRAALSIGYEGAGTVEFLLAPDNQFYFMEMNTRLQVEHPVTEMITGQDLVAWQLAVAQDEPLPLQQQDLHWQGHAMEARIYAEDPVRQFMPSSGRLSVLQWPKLPDVRIDTGVNQGDHISDHYDPMIAKVIAWGSDRHQARRRLLQALQKTRIAGIKHNIGFINQVLQDDDFAAAKLSTRFLEEHPEITGQVELPEKLIPVAAACVWSQHAKETGRDASNPWLTLQSWRGGLPAPFFAHLRWNNQEHALTLETRNDNEHLVRFTDGESISIQWHPQADGGVLTYDGHSYPVDALIKHRQLHLFLAGHSLALVLQPDVITDRNISAAQPFAAPMSGTLVACHVSAGSRVAAGDPVVTLEAMKMEQTLRAPSAGTVTALPFAAGDTVTEGTLLAEFTADEDCTEEDQQ